MSWEVIDEGYRREVTDDDVARIMQARRELRHRLFEAADDCSCDICKRTIGDALRPEEH